MRALLLALTLLTPAAAEAEEVVIFAAASMKTALDAVAAEWQEKTGNTAVISYAGSSKLAQQILAGAPADLFISAAPNWMDALAEGGALAQGSRRDLLGNRLVLVGHAAGEVALADLPARLGQEHLAMALVDSVPAGQYGKAAFESLGLWGALAPQVAQADNVRAALALVASGEAPYGVVYATDAAAEPRVHLAATFPAESHPPITYPAARLAAAPHPQAAAAFEQFLTGPEAANVFKSQGFTVLTEE